jgi:prepilin-type N-terminal cleavage/methylation domain-containing protein
MKRHGFTLIELLVYIGIFSILLVVLTEMLVSVLSLQLDSAATSSVDQDNRFIQQRLAFDIQRAKKAVANAGTLTLTIGSTTYQYAASGSDLQLNGLPLNSYNTTISNLSFVNVGASTTSVVINYGIISNVSRPQGQQIVNVNTVIGLRPNLLAGVPPTIIPTSVLTPTPIPTVVPTTPPPTNTPTPANCNAYCGQRYSGTGSCQRSYQCNGRNDGNIYGCTGNNICCCLVPTSTPTPTPTSIPCQVTTNPSSITLAVRGTGTVSAVVSSGLGSAHIDHMDFGSYNTNIVTVNPTFDNHSPYSTTVTAVSSGTAAVWATATLSDGRTCQSTGDSDTNITVSVPPTNTPTPTPRPTNTPTPTSAPTSCNTYCNQRYGNGGSCQRSSRCNGHNVGNMFECTGGNNSICCCN